MSLNKAANPIRREFPTDSILRGDGLWVPLSITSLSGNALKMLYDYRCQICGEDFGKRFSVHIVESHHIDPFVTSLNNDVVNQIIICPNHPKVIHRVGPVFDRNRLLFVYRNGVEERVV